MPLPFSIALLKAYHAQANVLRPKTAELGLSTGQPKILDFLSRHEGCMQKDLAALCDIEPATVSRLLDKMGADGLIQRTPVEGDKRALSLALTEQGKERQALMREIRIELEAQELEGFSPEEQVQFFGYLNRLYDNLAGEHTAWKRAKLK